MNKLIRLGAELNAYTFGFEDALLEEIRAAYHQDLKTFLQAAENQHYLAGGYYHSLPLGPSEDYYLVSYDTYPLLWIANHSARTYQIYHRFFEALAIDSDLKQLVDCKEKIVMYCGFLVVGNRAEEKMFHYDYRAKANAYTLITPLFEWEPTHGGLIYQLNQGLEQTYAYALNQAIVFGEGFLHSTEPYLPSDRLRILVSLTFGTDKFKYWDTLRANIEEQSCYYALPCGHIVNTCRCLKRYRIGCKIRNFMRP